MGSNFFYDIVNLTPTKIKDFPASSMLENSATARTQGNPLINTIFTKEPDINKNDGSKNSLTILPNTEKSLPRREYTDQKNAEPGRRGTD